jgi:hypothetical protein
MKLPNFLHTRLLAWAINKAMLTESDVAIGGREDPYMLRWYIIPRNRWFNIYLHQFHRSDDDRALHDHPWWSLSLNLWGTMIEHQKDDKRRLVETGDIIFRSATFAHRLELPNRIPAMTIFMTGPRIRTWGFHCPNGWRDWRVFTNPNDSSIIGPGCD